MYHCALLSTRQRLDNTHKLAKAVASEPHRVPEGSLARCHVRPSHWEQCPAAVRKNDLYEIVAAGSNVQIDLQRLAV